MKILLLLACGLLSLVAEAQPGSSLSPIANALAVPRTAATSVALGSPLPAGATLQVFSTR